MDDLITWIKEESDFLNKRYGQKGSENTIFANTIKLVEEVGELCEQVLSSASKQRQEKIDIHTQESLEHEIADVIITTLILADTLDVDIKKALESKIAKIKARQKSLANAKSN